MSELLVVGVVQRPHGLAGEVSTEILTDFPQRFAPGTPLVWRRGNELRTVTLSGVRPHGGRLLLSFDGISDADAARALQGGELCVPREAAFPAGEDFYYAHEVRGWTCEDPSGRVLGSVTDLGGSPAGPVLTVETAPGREALVPFVHGIVVRVDRERRRIVIDAPEGLLDL
jgi:16S rRNA processing protein RimM